MSDTDNGTENRNRVIRETLRFFITRRVTLKLKGSTDHCVMLFPRNYMMTWLPGICISARLCLQLGLVSLTPHTIRHFSFSMVVTQYYPLITF